MSRKDLSGWLGRLEADAGASCPADLRKRILKGMGRILADGMRIRPGFSFSWVSPGKPERANLALEYDVDGAHVTIFELKDSVEGLYHLTPVEYSLPMDEVDLIDGTRMTLLEMEPPEFGSLARARDYVKRKGLDIMLSLSRERGIGLGDCRYSEMMRAGLLSDVLVRYTAGYGIAEILLKDPFIQDIYVDAPAGSNPVYITFNHPEWAGGRCVTNVTLTSSDMESLLSRFRHESGRPFSESQPHLECDLEAFNTRVTVIGRPLSPDGHAMALRRHSSTPWTLNRLIEARSLTTFAAGLLSFLIDGRSTILVAGGRGAGKTALLGALMLEFPNSQRILSIEDTRELPTTEMQALGYKVQSLLVSSSFDGDAGSAGTSTDEALRVSLRLGESALVLGEVRGKEAKTLYEAMRTGTAGSSVLGTIHGNDARAVKDRVVHDIGIPVQSFSATDIIVVAGLRRPFGSHHQVRRVVEISELDKRTLEFVLLMTYDEEKDMLVSTEGLKTSARISGIASSWGLTHKMALENIAVRREIRRLAVARAKDGKGRDLLGAGFVCRSNNAFWEGIGKFGKDYDAVLDHWKSWFERAYGKE